MITYFDTSMLIKLVVDDEMFATEAARLWLDSDFILCAEIGYVEARAALAAVRRSGRLESIQLNVAKRELETLWSQVGIIDVNTELVTIAGNIAESDGLRGYDAVHLAAALTTSATVMASAYRSLVDAARTRGFATV